MLRTIISCLIFSLCLNAVAQETPAAKSLNGISYTIFPSNSDKKIKLNDVITFNFVQKTDKDSVLFSSFEALRPVTIQIQPSRNYSDLMDIFQLMAEKDSAVVKIPTDSIFKENESSRPPFFPAKSFLTFLIKIDKVQSVEQVMAEREKEKASLIAGERNALKKYIAEKNLTTQSTTSGLNYIVTKTSVKPKPLAGDTVSVNYVGKTLDGKIFDTSIEAEAKKGGLEQPGRQYEPITFVVGQKQVIAGWEEALLLLNEGSEATLLIPSDLAYGEQGAGDDILPYSSLIFEVELVKVKSAKKASVAAPAAPKSATPVKKPVAAPAKKPAVSTAKPAGPATKPAITKKP